MTHMTTAETMTHVRNLLHEMADMVISMVLEAVDGAVSNDEAKLQNVIDRDAELDQFEENAIVETFKVIVLRAPVAKDARFFAAVLSIIGELENAGDDAVKLARRAKKMRVELPEELQAPMGALAESVVQMVNDGVQLVDHFDMQRAQDLIESDSHIDSAYKQARRRILEMTENQQTFNREMFRLIEMFHALEHVADHTVEIAKRMVVLNRTLE